MANGTRPAAAAVAFDLTPLQNAHRLRGIGTYVGGLGSRLAAQAEVPIEFWAWDGELPFDAPPPHTTLRLKRSFMPEYRGKWLFAQLAMKRRAASSAARVAHITDPDALAPLGGRRVLATVYDLIPLRQGISRRRVLGRLGYRSYLRNLRRIDGYFAISRQTAADLTGLLGIPAGKVWLARPGIDLPAASSTPPAPAQPYFLYLGGPNPNKNVGALLEAMKRAGPLPEELVVAGHWLPKQVQAFQARLEADGLAGRVRHAGFLPAGELAARLRAATAVVVPSRSEGFGLPVGEGLAAGALVIHSRIPVLEETSAGAALTFDPDSPSELADCLRRASSGGDAMRVLRADGIRRARDLTWDAALRTTLDAYRRELRS